MKKLGIAAGVVVLLVAALVGYASTRPDSYTVERSRTYEVPAATVWGIVSDMNQFPKWSPWQKMDPAMRIAVEGTPASVGHKYTWVSEAGAGKGSMTVTAVEPGKRMDIALSFLEPFPSEAVTAYIVSEEGGKATMTWTMTGQNNLGAKVMGLFMSMESMIGKDFEDGLANLDKVVAEPGA